MSETVTKKPLSANADAFACAFSCATWKVTPGCPRPTPYTRVCAPVSVRHVHSRTAENGKQPTSPESSTHRRSPSQAMPEPKACPSSPWTATRPCRWRAARVRS